MERYAHVCGVSAYWLITGKPDQQDVMARLQRALSDFRGAVLSGEHPLSAWERILGRTDVLTEDEKRQLSGDPESIRAYLASADGVEWVELTSEQHRLVQDLVHLFGRYAAQESR
jgi:hypothetical protein